LFSRKGAEMLCLKVLKLRNGKNVYGYSGCVRSAAAAGVIDCERRLLRALHADWWKRDAMDLSIGRRLAGLRRK
jgi:hypothetical protein